jgi:hypothetical protein
MPVEIKELVIRTVLESGSKTTVVKTEIETEVKKQLGNYKVEIINQCIEALNEAIKRQQER